ncbi:hypothetical protein WT37_14725 [Burkholderia territorii]|nr:hypothetical protein WT37_14725 [Burkholderia territorii]
MIRGASEYGCDLQDAFGDHTDLLFEQFQRVMLAAMVAFGRSYVRMQAVLRVWKHGERWTGEPALQPTGYFHAPLTGRTWRQELHVCWFSSSFPDFQHR